MKVRNKYTHRQGTSDKFSNTDRNIIVYYDDFGCVAAFIEDFDVYLYGSWMDLQSAFDKHYIHTTNDGKQFHIV